MSDDLVLAPLLRHDGPRAAGLVVGQVSRRHGPCGREDEKPTASDGSHDFKNDAESGDVFELKTKKTKSGKPNLLSARKISTSSSCRQE